MATLSRVARIRLDDTATHITTFLQWISTAAVEQTAEGGSVVITTERTVLGATPPGDPATLTLSLYNDAGALITSFALNTTAASQTSTFFFTDTGLTGGVARHGTVEIALRATRTNVVAYDVESDGSPNTQPAGFDSHLDRGYIIGTTTKTHAFSNVSAGGAKNNPAEYDESLFLRVTLGSISYVARALATVLSAGSLSGNTNSTTAVIHDVTFTNVVDDRFTAGVTNVTATVTAPNATLTGLPYTVFTATTADSINVDPRLTASHHFQVDDNAFGIAKNVTSKSMLSTQSGFLWTIFKTARTLAGVNGLTVTQTLTPVNPGTAASQAGATSTQDSQAGVSVRLDWTASKPGGTWNKAVDITAPADIDADTHLITGTDVLTMLAPDPRLRVVVGAGPYGTSADDDHWHPGNALLVGLAVVNSETLAVLTPDASPAPSLILGRFNQTLGRAEYLDSDLIWKATNGATLYAWPLAASAGDAQTFIKVFANTTSFNTADLFFIGKASVGGTPYSGPASIGVAGASNGHAAYALDPVAFAAAGVLSFK